MQEELQLLTDLQELDQKKLEIDQQRQQEIEEQERLQADIDRLQEMVDALDTEISGVESDQSELQINLTKEQDNVTRSEERLPQIKTQKEYVAVLKEIDTAKKLAKELENQITAKGEELTNLNADKAEKVEELDNLRQQASGRQQEINTRLADLDAELAAMSKQRDDLVRDLPTALRKRYELLLKRRGGMAVVEAAGGACLGCNMHLPPQLYNSLYLAKEVQSCPHCNRLLFVTGEP